MSINANIPNDALSTLIGQRCCRQRVGRGRSLSVGFGNKVPHSKPKTADPFYGEWEIGTYSSAWRIISDGRVVCGSSDVVDSIDELDERLQTIKLGTILSIITLSPFDIRLKLVDSMHIDFLCVTAEEDEIFHIFGPKSLYMEYITPQGWKIGKSNAPWS